MIVVDTTVLVYAVGDDHDLAAPCRQLINAIGDGRLRATTTAEAIQEFVHVRARRRTRRDAAALGRAYLDLLSPIMPVDERALTAGLRLFERLPALGSFDAVLAAATVLAGAQTLVSADKGFAGVHGLTWLQPMHAAERFA